MNAVIAENKKTGKILDKYTRNADNPVSLMTSSRNGLKPEAVFDFIIVSGFANTDVERLLNKSLKTFQNYRESNTSLDPSISEKLLKLFNLYGKGITVFGSVEEFNGWMITPAFGLGNRVPAELLDTITGIQLVSEELIRIEFGDLA